MAFVLKDRVKETSTTTGTGTITLAGASIGYQGFSTVGNANTTSYSIVMGTEWENGIGTYTSSGSTLSRDTVLSSSNSGNKVNFSAGTKDVFINYPAGRASLYDTPSQSTGAFHVPVGTTGERPTGASGMIRMNSTTGNPEWYNTATSQWVNFSQRTSAGSVLQVVSTTKTDTFSTNSTTMVDVTGLSLSITPSSTSNKILIFGFVSVGTPNTNFVYFNLVRDSTAICIGDASTNRVNVTGMSFAGVSNEGNVTLVPTNFLDSPNSTSSLTYKIQIRCATAGNAYVNRSHRDSASTNFDMRIASTITAMEIAG